MTTSNAMTVRLPEKVKKQLTRLARATGRTQSYLAAEAIQAYVEQESWQIAAIEEGIAEAEAGKLVAHEDVAAWLQSWGTDKELEPPKCD